MFWTWNGIGHEIGTPYNVQTLMETPDHLKKVISTQEKKTANSLSKRGKRSTKTGTNTIDAEVTPMKKAGWLLKQSNDLNPIHRQSRIDLSCWSTIVWLLYLYQLLLAGISPLSSLKERWVVIENNYISSYREIQVCGYILRYIVDLWSNWLSAIITSLWIHFKQRNLSQKAPLIWGM